MREIISVEHLAYTYPGMEETPGVVVFEDLNLTVEEGTFVAVLGTNGCGKSTLAKHFNSILLPTGGKIYVCGIDTSNEGRIMAVRRNVGMVFQNPDNQIVSNIVEEDVAFAPENLGYPSEDIRIRVDEALKVVGMYEYREHAPHLLSGGQKQRIAIAGVLAMAPACVVFDEPTAMLDPKGRADVVKIIHKMREMGTTVVLITHHMDETIDADRLVVMADGKIIMDGTPKDVFCRVEELRETRLDVPETVDILYEMNKEGYELDLKALSVEECAQEIFNHFN